MEYDDGKHKVDLQEIKYMVKCLLKKGDEVELRTQRYDETIRNLKSQVKQLVEAFNVQQANIVDGSQEKRE